MLRKFTQSVGRNFHKDDIKDYPLHTWEQIARSHLGNEMLKKKVTKGKGNGKKALRLQERRHVDAPAPVFSGPMPPEKMMAILNSFSHEVEFDKTLRGGAKRAPRPQSNRK